MGFNDSVSLDETMAHSVDARVDAKTTDPGSRRGWHTYLAVLLLFAAAVYLACILSPPSLMDDVDAVQGQIARNMLTSGDWVTARLDGVIYLEKAPLIYWLMAISYRIFGAYDWAARIPMALSSIGARLVDRRFRADGPSAKWPASMPACAWRRALASFSLPASSSPTSCSPSPSRWRCGPFLRVLDEEETHPRAWAYTAGREPWRQACCSRA